MLEGAGTGGRGAGWEVGGQLKRAASGMEPEMERYSAMFGGLSSRSNILKT